MKNSASFSGYGFFGNSTIIEAVEAKKQAMDVKELAVLLGVSPQLIYAMAAGGEIPSFRLRRRVRFDPKQLADWLKRKIPASDHLRKSDRSAHRLLA
jgi:excisionase family DNA binding protein